jgi:hypothetical protein
VAADMARRGCREKTTFGNLCYSSLRFINGLKVRYFEAPLVVLLVFGAAVFLQVSGFSSSSGRNARLVLTAVQAHWQTQKGEH